MPSNHARGPLSDEPRAVGLARSEAKHLLADLRSGEGNVRLAAAERFVVALKLDRPVDQVAETGAEATYTQALAVVAAEKGFDSWQDYVRSMGAVKAQQTVYVWVVDNRSIRESYDGGPRIGVADSPEELRADINDWLTEEAEFRLGASPAAVILEALTAGDLVVALNRYCDFTGSSWNALATDLGYRPDAILRAPASSPDS